MNGVFDFIKFYLNITTSGKYQLIVYFDDGKMTSDESLSDDT